MNFLTDWRYWVAIVIGCVGVELAACGHVFWGSFVAGFAVGMAYFTHPDAGQDIAERAGE